MSILTTKRLLSFVAAGLLLLAGSVNASSISREEAFGDYIVHYNPFNSTFLLPDVAKSYGIERSKKLGLINISVLKNGKPIKAKVTAEAANLMAQKTKLKTWMIDEGDAIYYLTSFKIYNDELLHFTIEVTPEGSRLSKTIKFSQKVYED